MPFIGAKISKKVTKEEEIVLKEKLGKAIEIIPGKSENWLMINFESESSLYFKGSNEEDIAFIEIKIFGTENKEAFNRLTSEVTKIFGEVIGIKAEQIFVKYETTTNWGWNGSNF